MRMTVCVNTLNSVSSFVYSNHIAFWCETMRKFPKPEHEFFFFTPPRMSIDMARNTAAKFALEHECDYLLFIDDDVLIPPDTIEKLLAPNADIVAGLVIIRGYPFNVMAFKRSEGGLDYFNDLPKVKISDTPEIYREVLKDPVTQDDGLAAVGFSCCLIKMDLIRKIPPPFFITGPRNTEDVFFCSKASETLKTLGLSPLSIALATNLQPGHFLHAEPIEWRTIDIMKQMYEDLDPEGTDHINRAIQKDRDASYVKKNMAGL